MEAVAVVALSVLVQFGSNRWTVAGSGGNGGWINSSSITGTVHFYSWLVAVAERHDCRLNPCVLQAGARWVEVLVGGSGDDTTKGKRGTSGTANTGGGGGGGSGTTTVAPLTAGGAGGSGIVIIRYVGSATTQAFLLALQQ